MHILLAVQSGARTHVSFSFHQRFLQVKLQTAVKIRLPPQAPESKPVNTLTPETYEWLFQVIGLAGAGMYIAAYSGLQLGFWHGTSLRYILMNLVAASLVLLSLTVKFNMASAIIQITWISISIFGIIRTSYLNAVTRFSQEELGLVTSKFDKMSKPLARKLLNGGIWVDVEKDAVIATEAEAIGALYFIAHGSAQVIVGGRVVAECHSPSFVGEMTCLDGGPASATVRMTTAGRLF